MLYFLAILVATFLSACGESSASVDSGTEAGPLDAAADDGPHQDGGALCPRPAGYPAAPEELLMGPSGSSNLGRPGRTGEFASATLESANMTFARFEDGSTGTVTLLRAHGENGSIAIEAMTRQPGIYSCPQLRIHYYNKAAGPREFNDFFSSDCCHLELTRVSTNASEPTEGAFSGVVLRNLASPASGYSIQIGQGTFRIFPE